MHQYVDSIIDNIKNRNENLSHTTDEQLEIYKYLFVGHPRGHIISHRSGEWITEHTPPSDSLILDHLSGKKWGGSRYQKYTRTGIFDFDDKSSDEVLETRSIINYTPENSMVCTSVSKDSYHLLIPFTFDGPPVLITLVQSVFKPYVRMGLFELFPQPNQGCRWPFGKDQIPLDEGCRHLFNWEDQLDYFCSLKINPLVLPPYEQQELDLGPDIPGAHHRSHVTPVLFDFPSREKTRPYTFCHSDEEALDIIENGPPGPGTRNMATFDMLLFFRKQGVSRDDAIQRTIEVIRTKHRGLSKDWLRNPQRVINHIKDQAKRVDDYFIKRGILPTDIHCSEREFITKAYISSSLEHCDIKWPHAKSIMRFIRYYSTRKHRELVRIHCDILKNGNHDGFYLKVITSLETQGVGKRGADYCPGHYSKYLILDLPVSNPADAIYFNGRLARTLDEAIMGAYTRSEARQLLRDAGFPRKNAEKIVLRIYSGSGDKTGHMI